MIGTAASVLSGPMRRAVVLSLVLLAALAAAAPTAGAAAPQRALSFELHADGFKIQGRSAPGSDRVRLMLDRGGEVGYYNARARLGAGTVRARFGRLGSLDFKFVPARGEAPLGCGGKYGAQYGSFKGSLIFRGEHHYAAVDATRAKGWFQTHPARHCGHAAHGSAATPGRAAAVAPIAETGGASKPGAPSSCRSDSSAPSPRTGRERVPGRLQRAPRRTPGRDADRPRRPVVCRGAQLRLGPRRRDGDARTARARSSAVPSSAASPTASSRWWGGLRAPILGGRPVRVTGADFHTTLGPGA